jgi:Uma2 family endonuclease
VIGYDSWRRRIDMATGTLAPPKQKLLSVEEFLERHGDESNIELVDGKVVRYPMPFNEHGYVGNNFCVDLTNYVRKNKLGRVVNNDTFVKVKDNPARVRGADCAYLSFARYPATKKMTRTAMSGETLPELVAEVKSPSDTWPEVKIKVNDYLQAGVTVVIVLDPDTKSVKRFDKDGEKETVPETGTLTIPELFPDFACAVAGLFE